MKQITKIIIGLLGLTVIGIVTYYIVSNDRKSNVIEKPITNPEQDTLVTANVIEDSILVKISNSLGIDGDEFKPTDVEGVYTNLTNDKLLVINEDIWKTLINKVQKKLPKIANDCIDEYPIPDLSNYKFIGLLTYLTDSKDNKKTLAYTATEVKSGNTNSYAGGEICCDCEGEALIPQQMDAVIVK